MKLTFEVPDAVGAEFRRVVSEREGGVLVTRLLAAETRRRTANVAAACEAANRLAAVVAEDAEFERFDDTQP